MSRHYSDPSRAGDPYHLPDIEVFHVTAKEFLEADDATWMAEYLEEQLGPDPDDEEREMQAESLAGYYWWTCLPGCLPDSDPIGPFKTEQCAIDDAQSQS